jgi:epoxyqueuosine reductase
MNHPGDINLSKKIRDFATSIGIDLIGIAEAKRLDGHKEVLEKWLSEGMNATMGFLSRDIEKRINPRLLFNGAKSVIVAGINYYPPVAQEGDDIPLVSKYAYGKDYHVVLSDKLSKVLEFIVSSLPGASGMVCVDTSPILEKAWAVEAGLGWIGKNSVMINKELGSFVFLGEIIMNAELQYDKPDGNEHCGNCKLCIYACPTNAINANRTIDSRRCISWLTVENKNEIPEEFRDRLSNRVFGCDICQDVCPWNRSAKPHNKDEFRLPEHIRKMNREEWLELSPQNFETLFEKSSVKRVTYKRLMRTINFILAEDGTVQ